MPMYLAMLPICLSPRIATRASPVGRVPLMTADAPVVVVDLPTCQYLTPAKRRGWRGASTPQGAARGEDPEKWYAAERDLHAMTI